MTSFRRMDSVRRLRQQSADTCTIEGGYLGACCVGLLIGVGISIMQIAIGASYLHDCPTQPMIPVFLIAGGGFSLLFSLSCRPTKLVRWKLVLLCDDRREGIILLVLGIVLFLWLIVGTVFIVRTTRDIDSCNTDLPTPSVIETIFNATRTAYWNTTNPCPYCHDTVLTFSYAVMITEWCIVVLLALSVPLNSCANYIWLSAEEAEDNY